MWKYVNVYVNIYIYGCCSKFFLPGISILSIKKNTFTAKMFAVGHVHIFFFQGPVF